MQAPCLLAAVGIAESVLCKAEGLVAEDFLPMFIGNLVIAQPRRDMFLIVQLVGLFDSYFCFRDSIVYALSSLTQWKPKAPYGI